MPKKGKFINNRYDPTGYTKNTLGLCQFCKNGTHIARFYSILYLDRTPDLDKARRIIEENFPGLDKFRIIPNRDHMCEICLLNTDFPDLTQIMVSAPNKNDYILADM